MSKLNPEAPDQLIGEDTILVEEFQKQLPELLYQNLVENVGQELFPVQISMLEVLQKTNGDILCNAPTGSGKTLAYAIPIVRSLLSTQICRLRAVIIVPVKELVSQVEKVFLSLTQKTHLKVLALSTGIRLAHEQNLLLGRDENSRNLIGGNSLVDILITTPFRLMEHVTGTEGFTLQHVQYLVFDEADRLLSERLEWIDVVLKNIEHPETGKFDFQKDKIDMCTSRTIFSPSALSLGHTSQLRKLFFSATLKKDSEIARKLSFHNPFFLASSGNLAYVIPENLSQKYIVCTNDTRPLLLLWLLTTFPKTDRVLIFTKSLEQTHRLFLLIQIMAAKVPVLKHLLELNFMAEFNSNQDLNKRNKIMKDFNLGLTRLVVSSDVLARGIDVPDVKYIINYDMPHALVRYVHRIGRTARAGTFGTSIVLLTEEEKNFFLHVFTKSITTKDKIQKFGKKRESDDFEQFYLSSLGDALEVLSNVIAREFGGVVKAPNFKAGSIKNVYLDTTQDTDIVSNILQKQAMMNFFGSK